MLEFKKPQHLSFVAEFNPDSEKLIHQHNEGKMPILPLRDNALFPGTIIPISVGRSNSIKAVKMAEKTDGIIATFTQKQEDVNSPYLDDMYPLGCVCRLIHLMKLPDNTYTALLQAMNRVELIEFNHTRNGYEGVVKDRTDIMPAASEKEEYFAMLNILKEKFNNLTHLLDSYPSEVTNFLNGLSTSTFMLNVFCSYLPIDVKQKYKLLSCQTEHDRLANCIRIINNLLDLANIKRNIERKTQSDLDQQQREYFLMQEVKNIQAELGNKDEFSAKQEDISKLRDEAEKKKWSQDTRDYFLKEVAKLGRINIQSPDYNVQLTYLQTIIQLPWNEYTRDNMNIANAEKILNHDHYGMEKVKERILEHLAVLKMRKDRKSPIICLYGPPGVGKTSLGRSIANALNRKYVRISLGGVHDESEIRGHRRTYVGAMPGRIIKGMQKAGSGNPVFILDEIDKISTNNVHGDPSSALLEVLDPEQNSTFHDNYLDMDYDLSQVMFIATANDTNTIPRPLLDRMELIELSGYITEEKVEIGKRHLVPKKKTENGLEDINNLRLPKKSLEFIIEKYTRESGVRGLEKQIDKLFRKTALKVARGEIKDKLLLNESYIEELLGKPLFNRDIYQGNEFAGVVTGLAWTSVGGEILFIETSLSKGKGAKLTLTGNLGDVMKESAMLALEYIKAHAEKLNIDNRIFDNYNIHIHVPEGAVPKDGPSAGVTIATSIASILTQRKVRKNLAMTGEITLRGKVLPVGGIKEKILAAKRAGITDIVICQDNRKDIDEIPQMYLTGLTFHYVETIADVLDFALLNEKVRNAIEFKFEEEKKDAR
ncbi:MAG: endopeptidase La [Bacteroidaceae bacterium]|nr:endopeptidase La [Bacteroidaceae bacterium]